MKKLLFVTVCCVQVAGSFAQAISQKLQIAYRQFEADSQLRHAISSLYVINAKTGEVVFDKNSQIGLAPASTQKIITAATAFELLGKDYRYKTSIFYSYDVPGPMGGNGLFIKGSYDPTLGSPRYSSTMAGVISKSFSEKLKKIDLKYPGIKIYYSDEGGNDYYSLPKGWIWEDIGNYYGAGCRQLNWRENQYELKLKSGKLVGEKVEIVRSDKYSYFEWHNDLISAEKGTGDNAYIFMPPGQHIGLLTGTIPRGEDSFSISGALHEPIFKLFNQTRMEYFDKLTGYYYPVNLYKADSSFKNITWHEFYTLYSPSLDSIVYWFLKKSINLYGEAFIKTFAYVKKGFGSADSGVVIVKDFWKQKAIDENELNISDGSGLSPQNRVTTHAQVEILKYAKTKDWFPYFYDALPEYNKMKMKSGSIKDVKGYCGYQKSGDGNEYIFSFLVNNYNGSSSGVVSKMYKVLDVLK